MRKIIIEEKMTLKQMVEQFCDMKGRDTKVTMDRCKRQFEVGFGGWDVDIRNVFTLQAGRKASRAVKLRYAHSSQSKARQVFNSLWRWGVANRLLTEPYNEDAWIVERELRRCPVAFTKQEVWMLFRAAETHPKWSEVKRKRVFGLLAIAYFTGSRISHIMDARREDFNYETGTIKIVNRKSFHEQVFHLPPEVADAVQEGMAENPRHPRYGYAVCVRNHKKVFYAVKRVSGIPLDRLNLSWHALRKACATHIAENSSVEAASKHLGHAGIGVTIQRYIDPRQVQVQTFCDVLDAGVLINRHSPPPGSTGK
jgi:integrase